MKLIVQNRVLQKEELDQHLPDRQYFVVTAIEGGVQISRMNSGFDDYVFTAMSKDHFKPYHHSVMYWSGHGSIVLVDDVHESREKDAYVRFAHAANEGGFGAIAWGATPDDMVVIIYKPTYFTNGQPYHFERVDHTPNFINELIPGFAEIRMTNIRARRAVMSDIRPMDSIADLEKQVDLLTHLVFDLVGRLPAEERPVWFDSYKSVVLANDSTKFKTAADNISDIAETKSFIRSNQEQYFASKAS